MQDREFTGKVVEIINGDALMVKAGKAFKKIHLASIRSVKRCVIVLLMLIRIMSLRLRLTIRLDPKEMNYRILKCIYL